jgi:hypothetical protein
MPAPYLVHDCRRGGGRTTAVGARNLGPGTVAARDAGLGSGGSGSLVISALLCVQSGAEGERSPRIQ